MRISLITIASTILALTAIIGAALSYQSNPSPLEAVSPSGGTLPLGGLARQVSRGALAGEAYVEGVPERACYMHMNVVEVNGIIVIPEPGTWKGDDGRTYSREEVLKLMLGADRVEARGYLYKTMIRMHGHTHNILLATEIIIIKNSQTIKLVHEGGPASSWEEGPRGGATPHGPGHERCWEGGR